MSVPGKCLQQCIAVPFTINGKASPTRLFRYRCSTGEHRPCGQTHNLHNRMLGPLSKGSPWAIVDMTTEGDDEITVVTATQVGAGDSVALPLLPVAREDWEAVMTMGCFWEAAVSIEVETSFVTAA